MTRRYFVLGTLATLAVGGAYFWDVWRKFGALPERPPASPHWRDGAFHNLPDTYVYEGLDKEPLETGGWLKFFLARDDDRYPPAPVPAVLPSFLPSRTASLSGWAIPPFCSSWTVRPSASTLSCRPGRLPCRLPYPHGLAPIRTGRKIFRISIISASAMTIGIISTIRP